MPDPSRVRVSGVLQPFAAGFAIELARHGYVPRVCVYHLHLMAHVNRWLEEQSLEITDLPTPAVTPPNQQQKTPEKTCFNCGSAMHVKMVAKGPIPSAKRNFDGSYNRVETALVWRCTKCEATDDFKHADLLGFN